MYKNKMKATLRRETVGVTKENNKHAHASVSWKAVTPERTTLTVITGDSYISMSMSGKSKGKTNEMLGSFA